MYDNINLKSKKKTINKGWWLNMKLNSDTFLRTFVRGGGGNLATKPLYYKGKIENQVL